MAARDQQRQERVGRRLLAVQKRGENVAVEMVDGVERLIEGEGERFGGGHADDEAADQAGAARDGDAVNAAQRRAGAAERVLDGCREQGDVLAAGDLGDDAAVFGVEFVLVGGHAGEHVAAVADQGRGGVVARRFDTENQHGRSRVSA